MSCKKKGISPSFISVSYNIWRRYRKRLSSFNAVQNVVYVYVRQSSRHIHPPPLRTENTRALPSGYITLTALPNWHCSRALYASWTLTSCRPSRTFSSNMSTGRPCNLICPSTFNKYGGCSHRLHHLRRRPLSPNPGSRQQQQQ